MTRLHSIQSRLRRGATRLAARFYARLAHSEALPQLSLLGLVTGLVTGLVAVMFRLAIELPTLTLLDGGHSENFESLPASARAALPIIGALLLLGLMKCFSSTSRACGVGHVIERYHQHQGHIPATNGLFQFIGAAVALISGHSVGREGPAVHLGATCASTLGTRLGLPNNSLRVLLGCGVAAAISASFNTPLAGVIFAMEVVLMEYTIAGFIPIMLASISGAAISQFFFGSSPAFSIPALQMASLWELPFLAFCGLLIGLASAAVLKLDQFTRVVVRGSMMTRILGAGLIASLASVAVPQVMGVGYDTLEQAMLGELGLVLLVTIGMTKLLVSTTTVALGIPGGSIGPSLVIGACLGGALGIVGTQFNPDHSAGSGFYATVGMGAMMAGVLNAPLAALVALVELTYNPAMVLPAMLVITIASITARLVTGLPGLFLLGRNPTRFTSPVYQALSRAAVTSLMSRNFICHSRRIHPGHAHTLLAQRPDWIVIDDVGSHALALRPADLAHHLQTLEQSKSSTLENETPVDLSEIPAQRWRLHPISPRATLQEALSLIRDQNGYAVGIISTRAAGSDSSNPIEFDGIVTLDQIHNYYQ